MEVALGHLPANDFAGFVATIPLPETRHHSWCAIDVVAITRRGPSGRLSIRYRTNYREGIPDPPLELASRVTRLENLEAYWVSGLQTAGEFFSALMRHADLAAIHRLLDWGCGCGRVTSLFLRNSPIEEIHGCDVDGQAIAWCSANLTKGHFRRTEPHPPTPYADGTFDAIISFSVFTHLTRDVQKEWLREMRRVLKPGGIFLASVHGEFAASFSDDSSVRRDLQSDGISDGLLDHKLDAIAPEAYYRCVYQTRAYTTCEWSPYFDIVEYVERSMGHYQDLVVLRKPAG